ncbi:ComEA family DNA-binding protein [Noviherbaspirillum galbum]|nr:helix-hairpin-helix domain-containing protein [Noviherbaspirillum galbum]
MFRKLFLGVMALLFSMGIAFAEVEVNKADQAALDSIKGIGPVMSKRIIDERSKNGAFKDWDDFEKRVKGVGDKNSAKFSESGLTVNGMAKSGAAAKSASTSKASKSSDQSSGASASANAKSDSDKKDSGKSDSRSGSKSDRKNSSSSSSSSTSSSPAAAK